MTDGGRATCPRIRRKDRLVSRMFSSIPRQIVSKPAAETGWSRKGDFPLRFHLITLYCYLTEGGLPLKYVRRLFADAADAVGNAAVRVLIALGLVRAPVLIPVQVTAPRRR